MKCAARLLVIALSLAGSRSIFLSTPSCSCPMGGDMACCAVGTTTEGGGCMLRSCGGNEDSATVTAAAPRAVLAPAVTLPEPLFSASVFILTATPALALAKGPPAPPPRA